MALHANVLTTLLTDVVVSDGIVEIPLPDNYRMRFRFDTKNRNFVRTIAHHPDGIKDPIVLEAKWLEAGVILRRLIPMARALE